MTTIRTENPWNIPTCTSALGEKGCQTKSKRLDILLLCRAPEVSLRQSSHPEHTGLEDFDLFPCDFIPFSPAFFYWRDAILFPLASSLALNCDRSLQTGAEMIKSSDGASVLADQIKRDSSASAASEGMVAEKHYFTCPEDTW